MIGGEPVLAHIDGTHAGGVTDPVNGEMAFFGQFYHDQVVRQEEHLWRACFHVCIPEGFDVRESIFVKGKARHLKFSHMMHHFFRPLSRLSGCQKVFSTRREEYLRRLSNFDGLSQLLTRHFLDIVLIVPFFFPVNAYTSGHNISLFSYHR